MTEPESLTTDKFNRALNVGDDVVIKGKITSMRPVGDVWYAEIELAETELRPCCGKTVWVFLEGRFIEFVGREA